MLVLYSLYNEVMRKKYLNSKMVDIENTKIFFENDLLDNQIKTVGGKDQVQIKLGNKESIIHSTEKGFDDAKGTELEQLGISEKDKKDQGASSVITKLTSPSVVKPGSNQTVAQILELKQMTADEVHACSSAAQIIRTVSSFRVLMEALLTPYQRALLPLVAIEQTRRVVQKRKEQTEKLKSLKPGLVTDISAFVKNSLKYGEALQELKQKVDQRTKNGSSLSPQSDVQNLDFDREKNVGDILSHNKNEFDKGCNYQNCFVNKLDDYMISTMPSFITAKISKKTAPQNLDSIQLESIQSSPNQHILKSENQLIA